MGFVPFKGILSFQRHPHPFFRKDPFAKVGTAFQIYLSQLDHIGGGDVQTGCAHGVSHRTAAPCHFLESQGIEQLFPQEGIHGKAAFGCDHPGQQIERPVGILVICAGIVYQRIGQHVVQIIPSEGGGGIDVNVQKPDRQPQSVGQGHIHGDVVPAGIHTALRQKIGENVTDLFFRRDKSSVIQQTDGGHGKGFGYGVGILTGIFLPAVDGFNLSPVLDLGDADDLKRLGFDKIYTVL